MVCEYGRAEPRENGQAYEADEALAVDEAESADDEQSSAQDESMDDGESSAQAESTYDGESSTQAEAKTYGGCQPCNERRDCKVCHRDHNDPRCLHFRNGQFTGFTEDELDSFEGRGRSIRDYLRAERMGIHRPRSDPTQVAQPLTATAQSDRSIDSSSDTVIARFSSSDTSNNSSSETEMSDSAQATQPLPDSA